MMAEITRKKEETLALVNKQKEYAKLVKEKFKPKVSKKKKTELVSAFVKKKQPMARGEAHAPIDGLKQNTSEVLHVLHQKR